MNFLRYFMF